MPPTKEQAPVVTDVADPASVAPVQAPADVDAPPFSMLVYGPSKVGKSTVMLTAPTPILFLDVEGQTRFLPWNGRKVDYDMQSEQPAYLGEDGKPLWDYCRVRIKTFDQMRIAYAWLNSGNHPFKSVIVDSITEVQQQYVDKIAGTNQMETQNWGELLRGLASFMRQFRDLLEHHARPLAFVGVTAMMANNKAGKQAPLLQGKMAEISPYLLDVVGYFAPNVDLASGTSTRRMSFDPSPFFEAGSRVPGISGYVDNPDISRLISQIAITRAAAAQALAERV